MLSFDEALQQLLAAAVPVSEIRFLPLEAVAGRVLALPQKATVDVPPLANSAMDGYALRAADAAGGALLPISQRIAAGTVGLPLLPGTVARIFTGAPIPAGADAVVMQEHCEVVAAQGLRLMQAVGVGDNIRPAGEDMHCDAEILAAGIRLRAQDLALAAAAGLAELPVYRRLRVALLLTGDELVRPGQPLPHGAIYDSNRYALRAQLEALGCEVRDLGSVADDLAATRAALRDAAADNDLILTSGGVSVGEEDHVKPAVESLGRLDLWKVAIKPGKPLAFGEISRELGSRAWFVGLPGNPVSSFITFAMLVRPFILRLQGVTAVWPREYQLPAAFARPRPDPRTEFLRVRLTDAGELELLAAQGSGIITSLAASTGLVRLPQGTTLQVGERVAYIPYVELN